MECSPELAFSLFFEQWLKQEVEIVVSVNGSVDGAELGKIDWISPGNSRLISIIFTRSGTNKIFDLSKASRISYEDVRNDPSVPALISNRWGSVVVVEFLNGENLLLARPRCD
jgi:hypothetical protein